MTIPTTLHGALIEVFIDGFIWLLETIEKVVAWLGVTD